MELFNVLTVWHWLSMAFILAALDVIIGANFFLIVLGGSAFAVGIIVAIFATMAISYQLLLFAVIGCIAFIFWYKKLNKNADLVDVTLNNRTQGYIGRVFEVEEAIINGRCKIRIGDTLWLASSDVDIVAGVKIIVIGSEGVILKVKQV